jgi:hypothetical protein
MNPAHNPTPYSEPNKPSQTLYMMILKKSIILNTSLASALALRALWWVHTCNVTAYRNAVILQVTDTIRSYDLNFHPTPHQVTVSYERYTMGFPSWLREPEAS